MRKRNVIVWDKNDTGRAPDGTVYQLASEQVRPEPTAWWSEVWEEGKGWRELPHPTDDWAISKAKARVAAEHHNRVKRGEA